jgi:tetratricopeptide (TPR) repeat protein
VTPPRLTRSSPRPCNQGQDKDRQIRGCTEVIAKRLVKNDSIAYSNRCGAYTSKGDYDKAIADCDKAIELKPKNAAAYDNRGNVYQAKGDHDRAISDYDKAIELDPKDA